MPRSEPSPLLRPWTGASLPPGFGRGGEEAEHLRAAGIEGDVVNGITSGLAAATALGVPLTHRGHAHGVIFVTGRPRRGKAVLDRAA